MSETAGDAQAKLWSKITDLNDFDRSDSLAELANSLWFSNRKSEAIQVSFELLETLDSEFADTHRINCTVKIASWLTELGREEESISLISSTLKLPSFSSDSVGLGFLYWRQAENFEKTGNTREQVDCLNKAIQCFIDEDPEIVGTLHGELGSVYAEANSVDLAISEFQSAIPLLESEGCSEMVCKAKQELTSLLIEKGLVDEAKTEATDALALAAFLMKPELTQCSNLLLARVSSACGEEQSAEAYFIEAIAPTGTKELQTNAAVASFYQAMHWKSCGQSERSQARLEELVPVLKSFGKNRLAALAQTALLTN